MFLFPSLGLRHALLASLIIAGAVSPVPAAASSAAPGARPATSRPSQAADAPCSAAPARAAAEPPNADSPPHPEALTLANLVERAWERSPEARRLEGRRREAQTAAEQAARWLAGAPALTLTHRDDRTGRDSGVKEQEVEIAAPVWGLGQRQAAQEAAQADAAHAERAAQALRWELAGTVREQSWGTAISVRALQSACLNLRGLLALEDDVRRHVQAGELAHTDLLLIRQDVLAAQAAWRQAQLVHHENLHRLHVLTGVEGLPAVVSPPAASLAAEHAHGLDDAHEAPRDWNGVVQGHPQMQSVLAALERARQRLKRAQALSREPSEVGVSMRWQRSDAVQPTDRVVGLSWRVPLGATPAGHIAVAEAQTDIDTLERQVQQVRDALTHELRETQEAVWAQQAIVAASEERARAAQERLNLIDRAFRLGEQSLAERLRAQAAVQQALGQWSQDHAALGRALARLDQAQGLMP